MNQIYYNELMCNQSQIHSLGYAKGKHKIILIELRVLKNKAFFSEW